MKKKNFQQAFSILKKAEFLALTCKKENADEIQLIGMIMNNLGCYFIL